MKRNFVFGVFLLIVLMGFVNSSVEPYDRSISPVLLVYDDNSQTAFDVVILDKIKTYLYNKNVFSEIKKSSEFNKSMINDYGSIVYINNKKAIIFYGNSSYLDPVWAGNIMTYMKTLDYAHSLCGEIVENTKIVDGNFNNYICKNWIEVEYEPKCTDSDGLSYYTKGKVTWIYEQETTTGTIKETYTYKDECESPTRIHEYVCVDNDNYGSNETVCPNGCEDGACIQNLSEISKVIGIIQLVYDDNSPTMLDVVVLGNIQVILESKDITSEIKKNSEINNEFMKDKVTVFVYNRKAVVIYGEEVPSTLSIVQAGNIHIYLTQQKAVESVCPIIKSDYTESDDLKDYLCEEGIKIVSPTNETGPVEIPEEVEPEQIVCNGCVLDNKCYPLGYRKSGEYCSDDLTFVKQFEKETSCDNNFECNSNVCVSGECISEGLIKKILNWFKRLFGRE